MLCDLLLLVNALLPFRTAFHDPLLDVTITCPRRIARHYARRPDGLLPNLEPSP